MYQLEKHLRQFWELDADWSVTLKYILGNGLEKCELKRIEYNVINGLRVIIYNLVFQNNRKFLTHLHNYRPLRKVPVGFST